MGTISRINNTVSTVIKGDLYGIFTFISSVVCSLQRLSKLEMMCCFGHHRGSVQLVAQDFNQSLDSIFLPCECLGGRFNSSHCGSSILEKYCSTASSCTWSKLGGIHCKYPHEKDHHHQKVILDEIRHQK